MKICECCKEEYEHSAPNQKYCKVCQPKIRRQQQDAAREVHYQKVKDMRSNNYTIKRCIRCFGEFKQYNKSQGKCNACVQLDGTKHDNFGPVYSHPRDRWLYPQRNV